MAQNGWISNESDNRETVSIKLSPWLRARLNKRILPPARSEPMPGLLRSIDIRNPHSEGERSGRLTEQVLDRWKLLSRFSSRTPFFRQFDFSHSKPGIVSAAWRKVDLSWIGRSELLRSVSRMPDENRGSHFYQREVSNPDRVEFSREAEQTRSKPAGEKSVSEPKTPPPVIRGGIPRYRIQEMQESDFSEVSTKKEETTTQAGTPVQSTPADPETSMGQVVPDSAAKNSTSADVRLSDVKPNIPSDFDKPDKFEEVKPTAESQDREISRKPDSIDISRTDTGSNRPLSELPVILTNKLTRVSTEDEHSPVAKKEMLKKPDVPGAGSVDNARTITGPGLNNIKINHSLTGRINTKSESGMINKQRKIPLRHSVKNLDKPLILNRKISTHKVYDQIEKSKLNRIKGEKVKSGPKLLTGNNGILRSAEHPERELKQDIREQPAIDNSPMKVNPSYIENKLKPQVSRSGESQSISEAAETVLSSGSSDSSRGISRPIEEKIGDNENVIAPEPVSHPASPTRIFSNFPPLVNEIYRSRDFSIERNLKGAATLMPSREIINRKSGESTKSGYTVVGTRKTDFASSKKITTSVPDAAGELEQDHPLTSIEKSTYHGQIPWRPDTRPQPIFGASRVSPQELPLQRSVNPGVSSGADMRPQSIFGAGRGSPQKLSLQRSVNPGKSSGADTRPQSIFGAGRDSPQQLSLKRNVNPEVSSGADIRPLPVFQAGRNRSRSAPVQRNLQSVAPLTPFGGDDNQGSLSDTSSRTFPENIIFGPPALEMPVVGKVQAKADIRDESYERISRDSSGPISRPPVLSNWARPTIPVQRSAYSVQNSNISDSYPSPAATGFQGVNSGGSIPDIRALARELYPFLRRMIIIDKERLPF